MDWEVFISTLVERPSSCLLFCSIPYIAKWKMFLPAGVTYVTYEPKIALAFVLSILVACFLCTLFFRKKSSYPLPPGPPGKFLVGNLGQLSDHPEQDYMRWGKEYGE